MVPDEAYYGIQTQRAVLNFSVSGKQLEKFHTFMVYRLNQASGSRG